MLSSAILYYAYNSTVYVSPEEEQQQPDCVADAQGAAGGETGADPKWVHDLPGVPGQPTVQPQQHPTLRTHLRAQLRQHGWQGDDRGNRKCISSQVHLPLTMFIYFLGPLASHLPTGFVFHVLYV